MDINLKRKIHKVRKEIQTKFLRLKNGLQLRNEENQKSLSPITNLLKQQLDKMPNEARVNNHTMSAIKKKKLVKKRLSRKLDVSDYDDTDSDNDDFKSILNSNSTSAPWLKTPKSPDTFETNTIPSEASNNIPIIQSPLHEQSISHVNVLTDHTDDSSSSMESSPSHESSISPMDNLGEHINDSSVEPFKLFMNPVNDLWDKTNGPKRDLTTGNLFFGDSLLTYNKSNILIDEQEFPNTIGLRELILIHRPDYEKITNNDLENYKKIIELSNMKITRNASIKYKQFIKPYFFKGSGLFTKHRYLIGDGQTLDTQPSNTTVYRYDDCNVLVERLRRLLADKSLGNDSLDNEIIAVIEELREAGIIA